MTAPAGHPDPIYAGFARPFERNPTTRVPNQPHRGGKLSPFTFLLAKHISFNNRNTSHCTPYKTYLLFSHSLHWVGVVLGQDEALIWTRTQWAYRIRITLQTSTEWRQLVPIFTRILSPNHLVSPLLQDQCQCKLASLALKLAFAHSFYHLLRESSLHFAFLFPVFCMSTNKLSHFQIFPYILNIICACRAFIMLHLHLILPIGFAILHAGCILYRNKC